MTELLKVKVIKVGIADMNIIKTPIRFVLLGWGRVLVL